MKASDVWPFLLIGGLLVWWIFGRQVTNVVDLGPNAKVGGKSVDTRYKGPLETAVHESPGAAGPTLEPADTVTLQDWLDGGWGWL